MNLTDGSIYYPYGLKTISGQLYLRTIDSAGFPGIWNWNGEAGSLNLVTSLPSSDLHWGGQSWLVDLGSDLDFAMIGPGTGTTLFRVPKSGGSAAQLVQVGGSSTAYTDAVTVSGARIYFRLWQGPSGYGLWSSDGTPAGTTLVQDLAVGALSSTPRDLVAFNNLCYFLGDGDPAALPSAFFVSDGTRLGTVPVYNPTGLAKLIGLRQVNDRMFFFAPDGFGGLQLAISDGTRAGTQPSHISHQGLSPSGLNDAWIQATGSYYYFNYVTTRNYLYPTDGTAAGTVLMGQF